MKREKWASRSTFILAAIGSAVGLGNAWRFPGLAAKYGGGAFLLVYLIAMLAFGVPLLMMEVAIGRRMRKGSPGALGSLKKGFEPIGWMAAGNAFVIACYYAVVFAWVLAMIAFSFKFAGMTGDSAAAGNLFFDVSQTTGTTSGFGEIPTAILIALVVAWGCIWYCIRDGAQSVGKVVKFTVFAPVVCLVIMAVKGLTMPGAMEGIAKFFVPEFSALTNSQLWSDAIGQVFYSLSVAMAIMFAYGSFLDKDSNIAVDATIIAFSDMAISMLAGVVMFSTMGGVGMLDNMSDSGIVTAFIVYPQAIVNLTNTGWFNALFGAIFYICLATLAIDSAFSIIEGVSTAVSDKLGTNHKKTTLSVVLVAACISIVFATRAGLAYLDIVDWWANSVNLIVIGLFECIAVGWLFKTSKVLDEVNRNTNKFKMPKWWFLTSIKVISPVLLAFLFGWNMYTLFVKNNGAYGGYDIKYTAIGWATTAFVLVCGFVVMIIAAAKKKKGDGIMWDDVDMLEEGEETAQAVQTSDIAEEVNA